MKRPVPAAVISKSDAIRFDRGRQHRAKIGYVLLATEKTIEDDVMRLRPAGVGIHFARAGESRGRGDPWVCW